MSDTINVGLLGHGVVGGGVARTLRDKADTIARRVGRPVALRGVLVRDPARHKDADWLQITADPAERQYAANKFYVIEEDSPQHARLRCVYCEKDVDDEAARDLVVADTTRKTFAPGLAALVRAAADKLVTVADRLISAGRTQLFDAWCIADSDLAFMLHRLLSNGHDVPAKVRAFAETQWKRPSVAEFVAHARPPYVAY